MATERARINMNMEQPRSQHNYTEVGFKKLRVPDDVFNKIKSFYEANEAKAHSEKWPRGNTYTNHWETPTRMVSVEDGGLRGGGGGLKNTIWNGVRPILEDWTGHRLKPTSLYGIRQYLNGAILATHVDRLPLVSSCIINVAQDVNEPWPIEVYDHAGRAYNVTMEPGDMVLYESHTVLHGRPFPLNGTVFANIFVHFEPMDHAAMNSLDLKLQHDIPGHVSQGGHEADNHDAAELDRHKAEHLHKDKAIPVRQAEEHSRLSEAAAVGHFDEVVDIVRSHPEWIDQTDENGWQPLHEAVRGGFIDIVKYLVDHGSDIGAETRGGGSPLWWARRTLEPGHSVIRYLEEIGAPDDKD